jgi:hypothetical protein
MSLSGADIAWFVGLTFSAAAYYMATRNESAELGTPHKYAPAVRGYFHKKEAT